MPPHAVEGALLDASWAHAHKVTGVNLAWTPQLQVTSHGSQVHSQLKSKLRPLVKVMFSFHSSQSKSAIKKNQTLVEGLKEGTNFAFKVWGHWLRAAQFLMQVTQHMAAEEDG
ncbi:hypothetical protein BKA83DRAFT_4125198 [Pisolithus microcarpus]|nr:hypothetical protein BKA83DRAFT_4125198 [Pisolithus microcarpus]